MLQPHCTSGMGRELEEGRGCHVLDISPWQMGQFIGSFLLRFVNRRLLVPVRFFRSFCCGCSVSERHLFAADRQDSGLGCQTALVLDAEHFPGVLLRLLFGAEPLRLTGSVASGQKLNSVISHVLLSHLTGPSAHYSLQCLINSSTCPRATSLVRVVRE